MLVNRDKGVGGAGSVAALMRACNRVAHDRNGHEQREKNCFHHIGLRKNVLRWTYLNAKKVNDKSVEQNDFSIIFRERWVEVRWRTEVSITIIKIEAWINTIAQMTDGSQPRPPTRRRRARRLTLYNH